MTNEFPFNRRKFQILEVCAANLISVTAADQGGASRIELCASLPEGGTTPSIGTVKAARKLTAIPIRVLIRPRPGDFTYSPAEVAAMKADMEAMADLGIDGFVLGALTPKGAVDTGVMEQLLAVSRGLPWTFHRAFDFTMDTEEAMKQIIALWADTLLTSGQAFTALEGAAKIRRLREQADGRIDIMAGAGIHPGTILKIRELTGCTTFHLSGSNATPNRLLCPGRATLNAPGLYADIYSKHTDASIIREAARLLNISNLR